MGFPKLPARAAYLTFSNPSRRNALSLSVLKKLKSQLEKYNVDETGTKTLLLPGTHAIQTGLFNNAAHSWLINVDEWNRRRGHLPKVLVLRSEGPVFSSGHDLAELAKLSSEEIETMVKLSAEVMNLISRSPVPIVCAVQGT